MKMYPLLKVKRNGQWDDSFIAWTNSYLKELNQKIMALHHYSEFFIPDYKKTSSLRWDEWIYAGEDVHVDDDLILKVNKISILPYHTYAQLTEAKNDISIEGKTVDIRQGSYIISRARAEGQVDNENTRDYNKWYFWQPGGWASYYEILSSSNSADFKYNKQAEELYSLKYIFSYIPFNTRFFYMETPIWPLPTEETNNSSFVMLNLDRDDNYKPRIHDKAGSLWANESKPVMNQQYIKFQNQDYFEELATDTYFKTAKLENANVTSYNIVFRNGDTIPLNETTKTIII